MTFKEAYMRTGRILNISVTPADRHSPTKLLNYLTSPDTVIWSALIASAAVPGILNPVVLMQKTRDGRIAPWNWGSKFKDGSLRVDIPLQALNLYFNGMGTEFCCKRELIQTQSPILSCPKSIRMFISSSLLLEAQPASLSLTVKVPAGGAISCCLQLSSGSN
jgi:predicted acylesterase/phospholipase RssA